MNITRTGKYYFLKLPRLRGTPHSIALGAAIGLFIGVTPTIPFHTVAILGLTVPTRSPFIAGFITSVLICNPLTYVPIYFLSLVLGNIFTPFHLSWDRISGVLEVILSDAHLQERIGAMLSLGYEAVTVMLVGGFVLALPFGVGGYYLVNYLVVSFRRKRRAKQVLS